MALTYWVAPTANFVQTTLSGAITPTATSITLANAANMQSPGYVIIDRTDSNGNSTPAAREVISYTSISGNTLNGVTRAQDQSVARSHADGAVVETILTSGMWNSLTSIINSAFAGPTPTFDVNGLLLAILSPVTINYAHLIQMDVTSIASIARLEVSSLVVPSNISLANLFTSTRLDISAASVTGLGFSPLFMSNALYSGPTIAIGGLLVAPRPATLKWVSAFTRYVASGGSIAFDFKVRGASVFANATTAPAIVSGGTFVSTASIGTVNINTGDLIQADILSSAGAMILGVTIQAGTF